MAKMVKCPYCEEQVNKDESVQKGKRYFHSECLEMQQKQAQDYKDLIEYICELHGLDAPTGMMMKQIKEYCTDYKYKHKGIELALRYFYETLDNQVREGDGIGIVPYVYEKAKKHYLMKMKVIDSLEEKEEVLSKVITIESPQLTFQKKTQQIDIASL